MPSVVGVVGRTEDAGLLVEDAGPVPVAPQVRLLQDGHDVAEPAEHVERRLVVIHPVERALGAQVGEGLRRLEALGLVHVREGVGHPYLRLAHRATVSLLSLVRIKKPWSPRRGSPCHSESPTATSATSRSTMPSAAALRRPDGVLPALDQPGRLAGRCDGPVRLGRRPVLGDVHGGTQQQRLRARLQSAVVVSSEGTWPWRRHDDDQDPRHGPRRRRHEGLVLPGAALRQRRGDDETSQAARASSCAASTHRHVVIELSPWPGSPTTATGWRRRCGASTTTRRRSSRRATSPLRHQGSR